MPAKILKPDEYAQGAELLRQGKLVAFPTDTVYGVAGLADQVHDNAALREFKGGRPQPFSLHFPDVVTAKRAVKTRGVIEPRALTLTAQGVTVIVADDRTRKGLGVRVVRHKVGSKFLESADGLVVATSANAHGQSPLNDPVKIAQLPGVDAVIDDGILPERPASTVVRLLPCGLEVLREGSLSKDKLRERFTTSVEFVCLGNLNRSAFAHAYTQAIQDWWGKRVQNYVPAFEVFSSGLIASRNSEPPVEMQKAAKKYGVDLSRHVPKRFDPARCAGVDLAIPMGAEVVEKVREANPRVISWGILDPMGGAASDYELTARQVHNAGWPMLARLARISDQDAAQEDKFNKLFSGSGDQA